MKCNLLYIRISYYKSTMATTRKKHSTGWKIHSLREADVVCAFENETKIDTIDKNISFISDNGQLISISLENGTFSIKNGENINSQFDTNIGKNSCNVLKKNDKFFIARKYFNSDDLSLIAKKKCDQEQENIYFVLYRPINMIILIFENYKESIDISYNICSVYDILSAK